MTAVDAVVGLDIGTTAAKALIRRRDRRSALLVQQPTPWRASPGGRTELDAAAVLRLAVDLIGRATRTAQSAWGTVVIRAVSVGGIGESGILLDPTGRPAGPAIAWFDRRGEAEVRRVRQEHPAFAERFPAVTGLPWTFQATIATLLWRARRQRIAPGSTWLSVPEWIVHGLGGERRREPSLASRTGLIEQRTGQPWADALALAELPDRLLPDATDAGRPAGFLRHPDVPAGAVGAVLSVAGHDHPVAAVGAGVGPDDLFNSGGTADVLARTVPGTLDDARRARVVAAQWSAGRHVVPETTVLLAGVSGGLLLRRVLAALGAPHPPARDALDAASCHAPALPPGLIVAGDGRTGDDVVIKVPDGATPAAIWTAATRHTARLARTLLDDIEGIVGPHRQAVAAGGWTRMRSVRVAKAGAIDRLTFSAEPEPGATGAALLAEYSLLPDSTALIDLIPRMRTDDDDNDKELAPR
ncbi:MAG TPA: FGGY family carbohydrate kinase [Actinoplanes sp.]|nr:FGGY family carbohydrate kinase [Actinoplanes sp.]